jgi:hypothetical protein
MTCEGTIGRRLSNADGWPHSEDISCTQSVGLTIIRDNMGEAHYACIRHVSQVLGRVDRADARRKATADFYEDHREEVRSWGGKFGGNW